MKFTRRRFLQGLGAAAAAAGGGAWYTFVFEPGNLTVEEVVVTIPGLATGLEGTRIGLLSDFHLYPFIDVPHVEKAVALMNGLDVDVVALTGDFVLERAEAIFDLGPVLAGLRARQGVFAVLGNHDYWTNAAVVRQGLAEVGIEELNNRGVALPVNGERLFLAGVDDGWSGRPDLGAAVAEVEAGDGVILLSHEPDLADEYGRLGVVDLQLSGHSHGGQVRVPGGGALLLPYLGQKYDMGLYGAEGVQVYTTRGVGMVGPPGRFNCPPEVTVLTLVG
ncbi:MAG TPA: metallophosphoesterase [Anaerolineae bacterium]|nr:metallophosphoesterase [Anaerolineae bacterium]